MEQTLTIPSTAVTTDNNQAFLKAWKMNHILANALGLGLLHTLIAHGIAGPHAVSLTVTQFVWHTVSIIFFALLLNGLQNKALQHKFTRQTFADAGYFGVLMPLFFWLGYYTLYIPFDIIFMYLTIGILNAWRLRKYFADANRWAWQIILSLALGAAVGVACGFGAYFGFIKDMKGMGADILLWIFISIPASFTYATISQVFLKKQLQSV
ncbi:hypothetical protein AHMF7605_26360 [Adhaeribacter arboris]|uniref:Uncharacterized protein n=1 Tax=Adhaeribacter arboris TaxID=2072846 RepID=A0A2T2YMN7_9BACT|nr:hypothetical protein [Adhaeribacter arboris]PSR56767.1 hypothetical protein AHMF7605_26360 [Adhaeribacter arboris]